VNVVGKSLFTAAVLGAVMALLGIGLDSAVMVYGGLGVYGSIGIGGLLYMVWTE
jgi:hypothetical protein